MRLLAPILVISAVLSSGCAGSSSPVQPSDTATLDSYSQTAATASSALAAVRQATAAFHDVDKAVAAGYAAPIAAACVESPAGAMGVHSVNRTLMQDQQVEPSKPEVLLYLPKNGGGFRLVGVEYVQVVLVRNPATGAVTPWVPSTPWPPSYEVVTPAPSLFGQTFRGPMAGHEPGMPWHYDLHAWAWAPNPDGDFAQFNPRLNCEAGE